MTHPAADVPREDVPPGGPAVGSRRSFLTRSATVAGSAALLAAGAAPSAQAAGTSTLVSLYTGQTAQNFAEIRKDENADVAYLQNALGSNAFPMPQFQNLAIPANNSYLFAATSAIFENTGVGAYLAGGPLLTTPSFAKAGGILAVEAVHAGFLNALINLPLTLNGENILLPFSLADVVQNISKYLVNPAIGTALLHAIQGAPSAQNDVAILRFALLLEYLEADYYNINVPVFFGA